MAAKHAIARPLGSVLRAANTTNVSRSALRTFATTTVRSKELAADVSELPNLRHAQRGPQGKLNHAPIVNHADRTHDRASEQHRYGQYLLSCLPKYIQQYVSTILALAEREERSIACSHITGSLSGRMS